MGIRKINKTNLFHTHKLTQIKHVVPQNIYADPMAEYQNHCQSHDFKTDSRPNYQFDESWQR